MNTTHTIRPPTPAEATTSRPTVVAGTADERARLLALLDRAAGHLGDSGPRMLAAVARVSCRFGRLVCHWRSTTALWRAAVDLAAVQADLAGVDHLVPVRPAGGRS